MNINLLLLRFFLSEYVLFIRYILRDINQFNTLIYELIFKQIIYVLLRITEEKK